MKEIEILNKLFKERYDYLEECAKNILKHRKGNHDLITTLVNDAYMNVYNNIDKYKKLINQGKIESVIVNWMKMQIVWNQTKFKKDWIYKDYKMTSLSLTLFNEDSSTLIFEDMLLSEDDYNEDELIKNSDEVDKKLKHIFEFVHQLPLHQQLLFRDVYINGYNSSGKLAKHSKLNRTACYYLMRDLKEIIKNNYGK